MTNKRIVIYGGSTVEYVTLNLAICNPEYGLIAKKLAKLAPTYMPTLDVDLRLTKMAGGDKLETYACIRQDINEIVHDDITKIVIMAATFNNHVIANDCYISNCPGNHSNINVECKPPKITNLIRKDRKDIFLVTVSVTSNESKLTQYLKGLDICKSTSSNLVLAIDTGTKLNMVITPEESQYHISLNEDETFRGLLEMTCARSHLTFTRSTVIDGSPVPWDSDLVPSALRKVVDYCIQQEAYKPFNGATVGHFACKLENTVFLTSQRKTNFNDLNKIGLVKVVTDGPDTVLAYGAKPSVGGQSQRIIFNDHAGYDCVVHFHCPKLETSKVPVVSQREIECGSHQCGKNTSNGLQQFGNLKAVYLDNHGPNIIFNKSIDPQEVIDFIENNFDLSQKTGGFVSTN